MSNTNLAAYLTDHLAGSVVAIDLLAQLEKSYEEKRFADTAAMLRTEIEKDREELRMFMDQLGINESGAQESRRMGYRKSRGNQATSRR